MTTKVTIDLTDQEVEAVRRAWPRRYNEGVTGSTWRVCAKIYQALPPEPMAGGTCKRKGVPDGWSVTGGFPIWNIVFVDEESVVFRGLDTHGDFVVQGFTPEVFAERYEVLS